MIKLALLVSSVTVLWRLAECNSGVVVTAPKVWLLDSEEKVCVTSVGIPAPLSVRAELRSAGDGPKNGTFLARMQSTLNNPVECFLFPLKSKRLSKFSRNGVFYFKIDIKQTATGYSFSDSHKVGVQRQGLLTFIQTDKPVYKPGQTVKFRILSVKPNLLPELENIEAVYIEDPNGSRMMQWTDIDVKEMQGLADFEMPLSTEPVQGEWKVTAQIGSTKEEHNFQVKEYVLPKYEIVVKPPPYILVTDDTVIGEVCAKYTYGEPVKGVMSLQACLTGNGRNTWNGKDHCQNITAKIEGCTTYTIYTKQLGMRSEEHPFYGSRIQFQSHVREIGTDVVLSSKIVSSKIEWTPFRLNFKPFSPTYFKPGISYHGKVSVHKPDNTRAAGEQVHISVQDRISGLQFSKQYKANSNGEVEFGLPIPIKATNVETLNIQATMPQYASESSRHRGRWHPNTPSAYHQVRQWYSPSGSHVQIAPIDGSTACGSELKAKVTYTTNDNDRKEFHFQVISGGDIVYSDTKIHTYTGNIDKKHYAITTPATKYKSPPNPEVRRWQGSNRNRQFYPSWNIPKGTPAPPPKSTVASFLHTVPVTSAMSGGSKLLVFYVLPDGEVVADSTDFSVAECVQNDVKIEFLDNQKNPGEKTSLKLQADPGSLCSVGVVDKSVQLMGKDTQLTLRKVFDLLNEYDIKEHDGPWIPDFYCLEQIENENKKDKARRRSERPTNRNKRSYLPIHSYSNYVDSKQAFSQAGLFAVGDVTLETRPCNRRLWARIGFTGGKEGPVQLMPSGSGDNSIIDGNINDNIESQKTVEVRNFFPETWLWELHRVRDAGEVTISQELPHTITEWIGNAFCTNSKTGLGVSPLANIRAFQPFFVSFTLPYSVIRGEKVNLPVTVFNYLTECLVVELVLKGTEGVRSSRDNQPVQLCVCGQQSETHRFKIMASDLGEVKVTVKARSIENNGICGNELTMSRQIGARDAVTRQLLVVPEGREEEESFGSYLCPTDDAVLTEDVRLSLPRDVVPDSARAFINVIGDVMGPSLTDLDKLLRLPTGCGEQNMLRFAPNIYVMQYLTATNQLSGEIKSKATGFLTTGYQRELKYRHDDGSYSAFGNRDAEGSMWLTAFVVKSFAQARPYIYIDENDLNVSISWFKEKQLATGCFPHVGKVLHKAMKGGLSDGGSEASLTAYVLVTMLEAGISRQDPAVVNAIRCLDIQNTADSDMYTSSLLAYAYSVYDVNDGRYAEMMDRLWDHAINKEGSVHWEVPRPPPPTQNPDGWTYIHRTSPADVEATAYALMALSKDNENMINEAMPVVRWLTAQRNPHGGFGSTQDTVVGLQALAMFAVNIYGDDLNLAIRVVGDDGNHVFTVDNENSLILQQVMVEAPNNLMYSISGKGCVFVQTNLRYNVYNVTRPEEQDAFDLRVTPQRVEDNNCRQRKLQICAKYNEPDLMSNMAVVTVKMVSGWMPNIDSVEMLFQDTNLMLKRFELEDNIINFYFDELLAEFRCFTFRVDQEIEVEDAKPAVVHVFDYYEPSLSAMTPYKIRPYCGTKAEIPFDNIDADNGEQSRLSLEVPVFNNPEDDVEDTLVCPNCISEAPQESTLLQYICRANHTYKSYVIKGSRWPLRVVADLKNVTKLNYRAKYSLPEGCQCNMLLNGTSTILVFTKDTQLVPHARRTGHGMLQLDGSSIVVPLAPRNTERKLRRHIKRGFC